MSYYCHSTPGRLRIKTPLIKRNPAEVNKAHRLLKSLGEIDSYHINPVTGSITITYADSVSNEESILNTLREKGYFKAFGKEEKPHAVETAMSKIGTTVGKALLGACVEKAFEGSMLSFLAFLV
jgi:hypothetical protein